jgi:outer membrane immunogenic protein
MKNLLLLGAIGALLPTAVMAADPSLGGDRTYVGAQLGVAKLGSDWTINDWVFFDNSVGEVGLADQGFVAGVYVGHDAEMQGYILGAEADFNFMNLSDSESFDGFHDGGEGLTIHASLDAVGSLRGRIGVPMDNMLFYATAGIAVGTATVGYSTNSIFVVDSEDHELKFGGVIGAGVETKLTENVSARLQGLFYNFGSYTFTPESVGPDVSYKADATAFTLTAGLSWNF